MSSSTSAPSQPPKFEIGHVVSRPGLCALRICGHTHDGKYLAHPVLRVVPTRDLLKIFPVSVIQPGAVLKTPNGQALLLIETRSGTTWNVTHYGDLCELTDSDIEGFEAQSKAAENYPHVATRRNSPDKNRCRVRYLPEEVKGKPKM